MYKTLTKSPNASTKRLEDLVSPQQHVGSQANKAGTLASPRLGAGTNLSTGISSLKHTTSFFAAKSASHSTHSTSHHRTHSNDISSKYSVTDVKTSPRGASHHSQLNKKSSKTKSNQSQLHPISERSHDHKDSFVENIKAAVPKQSEIDLTKHVNLHTLEKTLESKEDKESDKDALHSKDSLDIRGPIRKTSVTNSEHRKEYEYKETITSPKLDTNSELDRMQRDNNSLVMDVPNPKMKKSITNLLNTINLTTDKPRHSPSVIAKRSSINKDQSQERRRTSVENGSRHSFVSESPPPASRFMPVSSSSVETGNIKVVARFRPLNKAENDLIANGLGSQCVSFPNNNTAVLTPENSVWTFDSVFPPSCRQQDVYDFLGKETIDDVLAGYNGTIFAYGQTSSGKTFTMYGNIHDQHTQGIIPRVGEHIFSFIDGIQDEVEFVINCSMLEIYKENLYDLLNDRTGDLKIKENPRKGIFVEGLNEISICSPEEMMEVLEIGERSRTIAATRMNQYSSRSHTLFMIDIIQRYPNRAEKRGKLNLIDLAGSEKVGKSGAAGETLEEAKKINLSLSCLGNVIHALTTNNDHIPYRDSKLTRILQESLGGNYKTSLIVTCSPHSSNKEESISTLKFATRAKTIKTHYKMNIQTSPDTMAYVMEKLKQELDDAKNELAKMKSGGFMYPLESLGSNINSDVQAISANFKPPEFAWKDKKIKITEDFPATDRHDKTPLEHETAFKIGMGHVISGLTDSHPNQIKPSHTLRGSSSIGQLSQLNRPMMERTSHDARKLHDSYHGDQSVHKSYDDYAYFKSNLELINENHILEARFVIAEKEQTIKAHEEKILMQKNEILQLENKVNTLTEQTDLAILKLNQQTNNSGYLNARVKVLEKEIESLSEALLHCEQSVNTLLQDKLKLANQKFEDMIKQDVELKQVSLPVYFKNFFNFNEEVHSPQHENYDSKNHSKIHAFANQTDNNVFRTLAASVTIPTNHASLVGQSVYGTAVKGSTLEDSNVSPQLTIYLLQQQLIQCSIINKQLERVISALEWKQIIEYGRAKIYSDYARMQENYIKNVEMVLEKAGLSHQKLKDRVEAMENDAIKLRETFIHQSGENKKMMPVTTPRAKLVRPIHKEKSNKLLFKKADATPGQSTTIKSHALLLRETSPQTSRNRVLGSYSTKNKLLSHDNFSSLMKEVEKEVAFSYTTPTTLEEAKLIISGQEQVIQKLKRCLKSNFNPENQHHYEAGGAHTFLEIDYLQSENERLENKLLILQTEFDSEKTKSEQLREAYLETKKQNEHYKQFNEELEISSKKAIKIENDSWQKIIEELRIVNENEILRKQEEINKMHDILAKWIFKFMELQEQRGNLPSHQEKILYETYKRQELPASGLLYTALGSGTKFTPESGGLSARTSIRQSDQTNRKY